MIKKDFSTQISLILGITVAATIFGFAYAALFTSAFDNLPKKFRTVFAIGCIVLGIFRSVMIYQKYKKREE
jgi:hypothetical protein